MLVEYEKYSRLLYIFFLDKNLGWVTNGGSYENYPEDY